MRSHEIRRKPETHGGMASLVVLCAVITTCVSFGGCHSEAAAASPAKNAIGICGGAPQTVGVTYERSLASNLAARVHVGSVYFFSSAGGRLQWGRTENGFHPYLFAGATIINAIAEGHGDPEGATGYLWIGPGASIRSDRWLFFAEVSALLGGDDDRGLGDDWVFPFSPAIAGGIMLRF